MKAVDEMTLDELREAVAVEVMGWTKPIGMKPGHWTSEDGKFKHIESGELFDCDSFRRGFMWSDANGEFMNDPPDDYPRDIAAAHGVLETLAGRGDGAMHVNVTMTLWGSGESPVSDCSISLGLFDSGVVVGGGTTPAEAICRAAVNAVRRGKAS